VRVVVAGSNCCGGRAMRSSQQQQFAPALGRHHAAFAAHQNGVAGNFAQPFQRIADGWLRLPQADSGARHALLGQQGVKHAQQISIEMIASVHGRNCPAPGRRRRWRGGRERRIV
jgi:hypothetical protein